MKIEKINSNGKDSNIYKSIKEASNSIDTKMDNWKVQVCIANALNKGRKAFGYTWKKIA